MDVLWSALTEFFSLPAVASILSVCDAGSHISAIVEKLKAKFADDSIEAKMDQALNSALEKTCAKMGWEYDSLVVYEYANEFFGKKMNYDELSLLLKQYVGPAFNDEAVKVWVECFEKAVAGDQFLTNYLLIKRSSGLNPSDNTMVTEDDNHLVKSINISNDGTALCVLKVKKEGDSLCLDEASLEKLKKLSEKLPWKKRFPIKVSLEPIDFDAIATLLNREDIVRIRGYVISAFEADQTLRKNFFGKKEILEAAIEFMLQDTLLDAWAHMASMSTDEYEKRYGIQNCFYFDENGIQHGYWSYFLWVDIIDELVKELLMSRADYYRDTGSMISIDCWVSTKRGEEIWNFNSFFPSNIKDKKAGKMWSYLSWRDCNCMDVPLNIRIKHLCPDLYYNMGELKATEAKRFEELLERFPNAFDLLHYRLGYH